MANQVQGLSDAGATERMNEPGIVAAPNDQPLNKPTGPKYGERYTFEKAIAEFFAKTNITQDMCNARAKELVGGELTPEPRQGACSYTVYAGPERDSVVQFRLKSRALPQETARLARDIFGSLAPQVSFEGQLGVDADGKEALLVYVFNLIEGCTHLGYILANKGFEDAPDFHPTRLTLVSDVAHFFSLAWKTPIPLDDDRLASMRATYERELGQLLVALPDRFTCIIEDCLKAIPEIMSLPMVLLHQDFGYVNLMVDKTTCHLTGVIDWAEATIGPFGSNLHSLQRFTGKFDLRKGWILFDDYEALQNRFWEALREDSGIALSQLPTIRSAMVLGLLLTRGFIDRFNNESELVPIRENDNNTHSAYSMLVLDGLLTNPATRFAHLS